MISSQIEVLRLAQAVRALLKRFCLGTLEAVVFAFSAEVFTFIYDRKLYGWLYLLPSALVASQLSICEQLTRQ